MLFLGAVSFLYFWFIRFKAPEKLDVGALQLSTQDGHALPENKFRGKAVILNFWAPWCGPCNLEAPWLQGLQDKHPNDLLVIGVDEDPDTNDEIPEFAVRTGIRYPLVIKNVHVRNAIGTLAGVPTTFYVDRSGRVVHTITGAIPESLMETFAHDALEN